MFFRCRETNCNNRIGVSSQYVLGCYCSEWCGTKFGGLRYSWSLSYSIDNNDTFVYDLKGKTFGKYGIVSILFKSVSSINDFRNILN